MLIPYLIWILGVGARRLSASNFSTSGLGNSTSHGAFVLSPFSSLVTQLNQLSLRQEEECSIPGGEICNAEFCCAPGENCELSIDGCCEDGFQECGGKTCCEAESVCCSATPSGCCQPGDTCCSTSPTGCCQGEGAVCCKSSPTGCCLADTICCSSSVAPCCPADGICCGDSCCESGEICERNECIDKALEKRIVRFEYDEQKNGDVLRNMCNGMNGQNTDTLTYRGKVSDSTKRRVRSAAGCKRGYCAQFGTSTLNSCDEWPPASSLEGGGTRIGSVVTCIPDIQNSFQGGTLSGLLKTLSANDQFVISIDCEEVLANSPPARRDLVTANGTSSASNFYSNFTISSTTNSSSFFVGGFGDLLAGTYSASMRVISGTTQSAFIVDSEGDNLTSVLPGISAGQTLNFTFQLDDDFIGVGLIIFAANNRPNITWQLSGNTTPSATPSASAIGSGPTNVNGGGGGGEFSSGLVNSPMQIKTMACLVLVAVVLGGF